MEDRFLREIVDLGSTRVREIMIPRVEVVAYDINKPADELRELIRSTRLKKIPVYNESIDRIVGCWSTPRCCFSIRIRLSKTCLCPSTSCRNSPPARPCCGISAKPRASWRLSWMSMAAQPVLVTLEDVLEEIVGEISDPEDEPSEREIKPLSDTEYDISGRLDVRYWVEIFGLPEQTERVATVSGLVTAKLGRPARIGDVVRFRNVELRVTNVHRWRIERLHLRLLFAEGVA